jgi:hypothetical protein
VSALVLALGLVALAASAAQAAYEETAVKNGGTLSGVVRFAGTPPKLEPLPVWKNREVCGEQKASEALVVGPDRGVRGSVVLIEGVTKGKKATGEALLDHHRCVFVSHVSALSVGERARVKNSDGVLHNTRGFLGKPAVFNLALPHREQVIDITRRLTRPGLVRVVCDAHPHMFAWLVVHDSPYVAVTDERGLFKISGVPPGTYRVAMWHEGFRPRGVDRDGRPVYDGARTVTRDVTITPNGAATIEFELK